MLIRVMLCFLGKVEGVSRGIAVLMKEIILGFMEKMLVHIRDFLSISTILCDFSGI